MTPKRYVLTLPVAGGDQFYEIADTDLNITVVSISARVPNAEKEARDMLKRLEKAAVRN